MEACLGLEASATDWSNACTSGSSTSSSSSCFGAGLLSFGSSPALIALTIRTAWNLANLILPAISGSAPQIEQSSRKVAAARKVSAVCLEPQLVICELVRYMCAHLVTLLAFMAASARPKTSSPNCSTYALAATVSVIVSLSGLSILNYQEQNYQQCFGGVRSVARNSRE